MVDIMKEIKGFLDATRYEEIHPEKPDLRKGLYPFVTISREYGAGGHGLARILLDLFERGDSPLFQGWRILDRELIEKLLSDTDLNLPIRGLISEEYQSEMDALVYSFLGEPSRKTLVYKRLFELIRTFAGFGKVIIVGRAGCCITGSLPSGVHVRLTAPLQKRFERMKSARGDSLREVQQIDRDRAKLFKVQFRKNIADPLLYDVIFNTDRLAMELIAQTIVSVIRTRVNQSDHLRLLS